MPEWLISLADAGGWAVALAGAFALGLGFVRGWLIPGWIYKEERLRSDRLENAMAALTKTVETVLDDRDWNERDRHAVRRRRDA